MMSYITFLHIKIVKFASFLLHSVSSNDIIVDRLPATHYFYNTFKKNCHKMVQEQVFEKNKKTHPKLGLVIEKKFHPKIM